MAINKVLVKIQVAINELAPTLELFVDESVQPSVEDCEKLQKQLIGLQENIAVYKYNKLNNELSPSFNIHAKLSQQAEKVEKQAELADELKQAVHIETVEKVKVLEPLSEAVKEVVSAEANQPEVPKVEAPAPSPKKEINLPKNPLIVGLNDKFRFLNELFSHNSLEYNIALEQLNNLMNWNDTEIYLNSLKALYGWKDSNEAAKQLFSLAKQRFT